MRTRPAARAMTDAYAHRLATLSRVVARVDEASWSRTRRRRGGHDEMRATGPPRQREAERSRRSSVRPQLRRAPEAWPRVGDDCGPARGSDDRAGDKVRAKKRPCCWSAKTSTVSTSAICTPPLVDSAAQSVWIALPPPRLAPLNPTPRRCRGRARALDQGNSQVTTGQQQMNKLVRRSKSLLDDLASSRRRDRLPSRSRSHRASGAGGFASVRARCTSVSCSRTQPSPGTLAPPRARLDGSRPARRSGDHTDDGDSHRHHTRGDPPASRSTERGRHIPPSSGWSATTAPHHPRSARCCRVVHPRRATARCHPPRTKAGKLVRSTARRSTRSRSTCFARSREPSWSRARRARSGLAQPIDD